MFEKLLEMMAEIEERLKPEKGKLAPGKAEVLFRADGSGRIMFDPEPPPYAQLRPVPYQVIDWGPEDNVVEVVEEYLGNLRLSQGDGEEKRKRGRPAKTSTES